MLPKILKCLIVFDINYLIIWGFPKCSVHGTYCFSCKWCPKSSMNWISLWKGDCSLCFSLTLEIQLDFSIQHLNSLSRIRWPGDQNYQWRLYKYDPEKSHWNVAKNLNEPKFDIRKSLDTLVLLSSVNNKIV